MLKRPFQQKAGGALVTDSYYVKVSDEGKTREYAYIHIDEDDGDYSFLIVFASCNGRDYEVYQTYGMNKDKKEYHKHAIQEFAQEVDEIDPAELTKEKPRWRFLKNPYRELNSRVFEVVRIQHNELEIIKKDEKYNNN